MTSSGLALLFDLETTDLPPRDLRDSGPGLEPDWNQHARYPFACEVGWQLVNSDDPDEVYSEDNYLIAPDGWELSTQTQMITGITPKLLEAEGVPAQGVMDHFQQMLELKPTLVTHNVQFDWPIMQIELLRHGYVRGDDYPEDLPYFCTMLSMVDYCKIPGRYGFKWPKLSEVYQALFKTAMPKPGHRAINDVDMMRQCLKKMIGLRLVQL